MAADCRSTCRPRGTRGRAGRSPVGDIARHRAQRTGTGGRSAGTGSDGDAAQPDETVTGDKSLTSRIAETDPALLGRTDSTPVEVLVKLDYDSVATYQGSVDGLAPTSPSVTGRCADRRVAAPSAPTRATSPTRRRVFLDELAEVAPDATGRAVAAHRLRRRRRHGAGQHDRRDRWRIPNVVAVQKDELHQPLTDASPDFIGADSLYPRSAATAGRARASSSACSTRGAWPEHPSFADQGHMPAPPPASPTAAARRATSATTR